MFKILSTFTIAFIMFTGITVSNTAEARGFICMVCGNGFDIRIGDSSQNIGHCNDGYEHFFTPTGSTFLKVMPDDFFEETVHRMQGNWTDENGNTVSVQGRYLNGCFIRSMVMVMKNNNLNEQEFKLILQEERTNSAQIEVNAYTTSPHISFKGIKYYRK